MPKRQYTTNIIKEKMIITTAKHTSLTISSSSGKCYSHTNTF